MLSGLGAVWQSFLGFAVYDVLGKIRIPCPALTSLLRQRHFSKRNNFVMPERRSYRTDTRVRVAGDFRLSHRITNESSTFAVFSRLSLTPLEVLIMTLTFNSDKRMAFGTNHMCVAGEFLWRSVERSLPLDARSARFARPMPLGCFRSRCFFRFHRDKSTLLGIAEQHIRHAAVDCRPNGARPCGSAAGETRSKAWRDACARVARRLCK